MLEEFILSQLQEIGENREKLTNEMNQLAENENDDNKEIDRILKEEDLGLELFSPRSANNGIREQIAAIKTHIDELQVRQTQIRVELEQSTLNENKYQEMLLEIRSSKEKNHNLSLSETQNDSNDASSIQNLSIVGQSDKNDHIIPSDGAGHSETIGDNLSKSDLTDQSVPHENNVETDYVRQLEIILKRVDTCIELSHRDKIKCRNELKNLRYYLKAVISKKQKETDI